MGVRGVGKKSSRIRCTCKDQGDPRTSALVMVPHPARRMRCAGQGQGDIGCSGLRIDRLSDDAAFS
jgi:hypothetical protein